MTTRFYSSVAPETTLSSGISAVATSMTVGSVSGLPVQYPFTMSVDYEGVTEELVSVTNAAGTTLTITRAFDGTSASTHNAGARVRHVSSAIDFKNSRDHENASADVHGIGAPSSVVGTNTAQTLANKTLNMATGTLNRVDIFNLGGWQTTINGDAGFPSTNLLTLNPTSVANYVFTVDNSGTAIVRNKAAQDALVSDYRFRVTKSDGSTDIFYTLSGGNVKTFPESGQSGFIVQPKAETDNRAFRVLDPTGATTRAAIFGNGRMDLNPVDPALTCLDLVAPAAHAASYIRIRTNAGVNVFDVASTNKATSSGTMDVRNINSSAGVTEPVLRVFGRNPGQTGNLQQWIDSGGTIRARVKSDGTSDFTGTVTTTGIITPASGWSTSSQIAVNKAGYVTINLAMTRTGAPITASAAGNLAGDPPLGTLGAAFLPHASFTSKFSIFFANDADDGSGAASLFLPAGNITLDSFSPTATIQTGSVVHLVLTYPLDFA